MKHAALIVLASLCVACSGGDWVDAPSTCMQLSGRIDIWNIKAPADKRIKGDDPTEMFQELLEKKREAGASSEEVEQMEKKMESTLTFASRALCSSIGKSYTGDWECTADQQRIKCK